MVSICPKCSSTNAPKAKFCRECGAPLGVAGQATAPAGGESPALPEIAPVVSGEPFTPPEIPLEEPAPKMAPPGPSASASEPPVASSLSHETDVLPQATNLPDEEAAIEKQIEELIGETAESPASHDTTASRIVAEAGLPIAAMVEVSFERVFVAGSSSHFSVRVSNLSPEHWGRVELWIESTAFTKSPRVRLPKLAPGASAERSVEVQVTDPGNPLLNCTLDFEAGAERLSYAGNRSIRVLDRPATLGNVSISIGDILSNRDGGVSDNEKAVVSNLVDLSKVQTLNDLLNLEIPKKFETVRLFEDFKSLSMRPGTTVRSLTISETSLGAVEPGNALVLRPLTGNPDATIAVVSRSVFRLGRSGVDADFAAWFLPRSPENDARTKRLSRVHALCEEIGSALWVKDAGSSNGSNYENKPLRAGVQLERRGLLELGGDYRLQATYFPSAFPGDPPIGNIARWSASATPPRAVRGAVRFEQPPDTDEAARAPWQSLWLLTDATFGSSHANPLALASPGLADTQGRFHALRGCFLLENLLDDSAVAVDGRTLHPGELRPLHSGMKIVLGTAVYETAVRP